MLKRPEDRLINLPEIRLLSGWQPYPYFIGEKLKGIETRDWYTAYRGWIAIHAAQRKIKKQEFEDLHQGTAGTEANPIITRIQSRNLVLPHGAITAIAYLYDCQRMVSNQTELQLSDFKVGDLVRLRAEGSQSQPSRVFEVTDIAVQHGRFYSLPNKLIHAGLVIEEQTALERSLGWWAEGRYGFIFDRDRIQVLPEPIPYKATQTPLVRLNLQNKHLIYKQLPAELSNV